MINSFGIQLDVTRTQDSASSQIKSLTIAGVLGASVAAIGHSNSDVKNAAIKIVLDVQRLTGKVKENHLAAITEKKTRDMVREKVAGVVCQIELNPSVTRNNTTKE